jgi:CelD/BcsL family acetyltransferase involved in cellulose biosynthesis
VTLLDLDSPRWRDFVESQPSARIFHHPEWARLLADCYGYPARAVALTMRGGAVTAGLPVIDVSGRIGGRRWVSLPFTDSCPLVADESSSDVVAALLDISHAAKLDVLELRGPLPAHAAVQSSAAFVVHDLALTDDPRATWAGFRKNHRRSVRDAEKAGVRIVQGSSAADLDIFYRLHLRTRRRLGVPIQPRRFFRLLFERIIQPGLGFVLIAYADSVPVAAAIFTAWNGTVTYKYGARDERFPKLDASHLIFWTAIQRACEEGHRTFDFGRSDLQQTSLRAFKSGWGAHEEQLAYSWIARSPIRPSTNRLEKVMGVLIRNSTPWLCRALGEALYKYAA